MNNWRDSVPPFKWHDNKVNKIERTTKVVSEARLPFGCKAEIRVFTFDGKLVTYNSCILMPSVKGKRDAYSLEEAKENARESWLELLGQAIGVKL